MRALIFAHWIKATRVYVPGFLDCLLPSFGGTISKRNITRNDAIVTVESELFVLRQGQSFQIQSANHDQTHPTKINGHAFFPDTLEYLEGSLVKNVIRITKSVLPTNEIPVSYYRILQYCNEQ